MSERGTCRYCHRPCGHLDGRQYQDLIDDAEQRATARIVEWLRHFGEHTIADKIEDGVHLGSYR